MNSYLDQSGMYIIWNFFKLSLNLFIRFGQYLYRFRYIGCKFIHITGPEHFDFLSAHDKDTPRYISKYIELQSLVYFNEVYGVFPTSLIAKCSYILRGIWSKIHCNFSKRECCWSSEATILIFPGNLSQSNSMLGQAPCWGFN